MPDCDYVPKTKLLLEKILGMEFYDPVDRSLFYAGMKTSLLACDNGSSILPDPGYSFTEVLFYGHEWSLFSLEVLLFAVVDLAAQNYVLAAVITFAVTQVNYTLGRSKPCMGASKEYALGASNSN